MNYRTVLLRKFTVHPVRVRQPRKYGTVRYMSLELIHIYVRTYVRMYVRRKIYEQTDAHHNNRILYYLVIISCHP